MIRKLLFTTAIFFSLNNLVFAGNEDWVGTFSIQDSKGKTQEVVHAPTFVKMMFIRAKSFTFTKGAKFNDVVASEDGNLATDMKVEHFEREVKKLGHITDKEVDLGPSYPKQ